MTSWTIERSSNFKEHSVCYDVAGEMPSKILCADNLRLHPLNRGLRRDARRRKHFKRSQRAAGHRQPARIRDHDRKLASGWLDIGQHERGFRAERDVGEGGAGSDVRAPLVAQRLSAGGGSGERGRRAREIGLVRRLLSAHRLAEHLTKCGQ